MTDQTIAENAVRQLTAFYSDAINHQEPARAASVYAPDGRLAAFEAPELVGREAIGAAIAATVAPLLFVHQNCHSGLISVTGDRATARWSVFEVIRRQNEDGLAIFAGSYEDEIVRLEEGWRFSRRCLRLKARAMLDISKMKIAPELARMFDISI
jgi:hypothetical protein